MPDIMDKDIWRNRGDKNVKILEIVDVKLYACYCEKMSSTDHCIGLMYENRTDFAI